jgi:hypothetical protein
VKHHLLAIMAASLLVTGAGPAAALASDQHSLAQPPAARPVNPDYASIKAAIDAQASGQSQATAATSAATPSTLLSWQGVSSNNVSPADPTGAIGPDRYLEIVNEKIGVYDRSGKLLSSNTEGTWTGFGGAAYGDGQLLWDIHDQRFYYAMLYIQSSPTSYELAFGFSKTGMPSANAADWCSYHSTFGAYGSAFPDYPKLSTTTDFLLIGVNRFDNSLTTYEGSDVAWVTKPPTGSISSCPALSNFALGVQANLLNADGSQASTPVPGRQTDASSTGYVIANEDPGAGSSSVVSIFQVTKNTGGTPTFSAASPVTVAAYAYPPSAPQRGTSDKLDTLDARLMNAWVSPDPNRSNALALWTQHTVAASAGGLGSEVRWYEIDPTNATLFQNGIAQSPSLYVFDGAISSDRNGTSSQFGGNMVLGFNTSSSTSLAAAQMISKIGSNPQSSFVMVRQSQKADMDFTCSATTPCRWGDYSGASPDPAATGAGRVWLSQMLSNGGSRVMAGWISWNWEATP